MDEPRCPRYPCLDFWRGIACLMVVVFHCTYYAHPSNGVFGLILRLFSFGWLGVPTFFVISGYCISATCDSMRRHPKSVRTYLWRRYRRIFPPFWVCTAFYIVVVLGFKALDRVQLFADGEHPIPDPQTLSISQWIGNLTLVESWRGAIFSNTNFFLGHAWTLCYEEQFYLICGLLLFLAPSKFFKHIAWITAGVALVLVCSLYYPKWNTQGFFFDGRWFLFAVGVFVYWILNYSNSEAISRFTFLMEGNAVACAILMVVSYKQVWPLRIRTLELFVGVTFAVVLLYLRKFDKYITRSHILAPITLCGTMCYSLYLVHWPIDKWISHVLSNYGLSSSKATVLVVVPICTCVSIAFARLFHLSIERHFLNPHVEARPNALSGTNGIVAQAMSLPRVASHK